MVLTGAFRGGPPTPRPLVFLRLSVIAKYLEGEISHADDPPSLSDRSRLEALRDLLDAVLKDPETSPRDLATVSREYRLTVAALAGLAPASGGSALDEIAARRRQRGAG